ncbi:MAG: hypothetical protein ACTSP3_14410, partial [Candidatus Heimdallarchaeaceae archaeon]
MSLKSKIMATIFKHTGFSLFKKILTIEETLAEKNPVVKCSPNSPQRFNIPLEFYYQRERDNVDMPLNFRVLPHMISSMKNIKRTFKNIKKNPTNPKERISPEDFEELQKYAKSLGVADLGFTTVPSEFIFQKKSILYENTIVLVMKMENEKINKAPSKTTLKNVWYTYDQLGKATINIAAFLRKKGYSSHASHPLGGIVLYPRLAEKAGLGSFGKSGILITPVNGPTVRLSAIFTNIKNLPISKDNKHSWIRDYCETCKKCIKACPPQAIYETPIKHETGRVTHI